MYINFLCYFMNRTKIQIGETAFLFLLPRVSHPTSTSGSSARGGSNDGIGYISTPQLEKSNSMTRIGDVDDDPSVYATNKDIKPPYSYAHLIAQAINSTEDKRMALHEIYNYITTHFPYYQMAQNGWQVRFMSVYLKKKVEREKEIVEFYNFSNF